MKSMGKIFITVLGIGGTLFGVYSHFSNLRKREPTFIVNPLQPILVDKELLKDRPINILDTAGNYIDGNVSVITFYFFNQGNEPIKNEDILKPLTVILPKEGRILDYKILKVSREVIDLKVKINDSLTFINFNFRILEKDDGFTCQVIFNGKINPTVKIEGVIVGVDHFETSYKPVSTILFTYIGTGIVLTLVILIVYFIRFLTTPFTKDDYDKLIEDKEIDVNISFEEFNKPRQKKTFSDWLTNRYQLVVRNEEHFAEKNSISFTYAKVIAVSMTFFTLLFAGSLFLSKTVLAKWFDPQYKSERIIIPDKIKP